jgi:hypothetical protein
LQKRLAEAEAAEAARKKPAPESIPKGTMVVDGLVIDEWVSQVYPLSLRSSCHLMTVVWLLHSIA